MPIRRDRRAIDEADRHLHHLIQDPHQPLVVGAARKRNATNDKRYYSMLQSYGGVVSANDLDGRGFNLCMAFLEAEGFDREPVGMAR